MQVPPDRWVEAKTNQGWGIAALVVGLAVVCIVAVTIIHNRTYRSPNDVRFHGVGSGPASAAPAAH
jgi:hypothetical protein